MKKFIIDSTNRILWCRGDKSLSILSYREAMEGLSMQTGTIQHIDTGIIFVPPFRMIDETIKRK